MYLLSLVADLDEAAIGASLSDLQVSLSAGGDTEILQAAFLALFEKGALARGPQRRGATGRREARVHGGASGADVAR